MVAVAALLDGRGAAATLRRALAGSGRVPALCRHPRQLARVLDARILDAMVLGARAAAALDFPALRMRYPRVPLIIFGVVRPDDGSRVVELVERLGAAAVLLEGLDDPILGDVIARHALASRRCRALEEAPRVLRLSSPVQRAAWEILLRSTGARPCSREIAQRLRVSREHLSRQFGAGGAPNLKRVVDFLQVIGAHELLRNPGYPPPTAARLLGYSTARQLRTVTQRTVRLSLAELPRASVGELLKRFVSGGMRSRG